MILSEDFTSVYTLKKYLRDKLTGIDVKSGWPLANDVIKFPSISLMLNGNGELTKYPVTYRDHIAIIDDDVNVTARFITGQYEMTISGDIWASSQSELGNTFRLLKDAINYSSLNNIDNPEGLIVELEGYYNTLARYDIVGYNYVNGEAEAQRQEYRMKVRISCHFDEVFERIVPLIKVTEVQQEIE